MPAILPVWLPGRCVFAVDTMESDIMDEDFAPRPRPVDLAAAIV
jgi:hypothetical protein